jgi:ribosomal protein L7/L12
MFVPIWLLVLAGVAIAVLALAAVSRGRSSGEMIEHQQRNARRMSPQAGPGDEAVLAVPEVRLALASGQKIEAIRLVREHTGLGLKESKELVERLQGR